MPDMSKRIFIVDLPADRPELRTAFAQLASRQGWRQSFQGRDAETGEVAIVQFGGIDLVAHQITTETIGGDQ